MMYDPKTGKGYKADKEEDHIRMSKMGYTHDKPKEKLGENDAAPATSTASIPNPATTAMGPSYRAMTVHDRRRKKKDHPVLLKRFRKYMDDNG